MDDYKNLSNEELMAIAGDIPSEYQNMSDSDLEKLAGGSGSYQGSSIGEKAGVAGLGAIGAGGAYLFAKPWLQEGTATKSIYDIGKSVGVTKAEDVSYVPKALGSAAQQTKATLKPSIENFDNTILKKSINDLSTAMERGQADWVKAPMKAYGKALNDLSTSVDVAGNGFTNWDFGNKVLQRTIDEGADILSQSELAKLAEVNGRFNVATGAGKLTSAKPMTAAEAEKIVQSLTKSDPTGKMAFMLRNNQADFLETVTTDKQVLDAFRKVKTDYKPYAEARKTFFKIKNPRTGATDKEALAKYLYKYSKSKYDTGVEELMSMLGEKGNITEPIAGVKQGFENLKKTKTSRIDLENSIKTKVNDILKAKAKSEQLLSRIRKAQAGKSVRKGIVKGVAGIGGAIWGLGKIAGGLGMGVANSKMDALAMKAMAQVNPTFQLNNPYLETGTDEEQRKAFEEWKIRNAT